LLRFLEDLFSFFAKPSPLDIHPPKKPGGPNAHTNSENDKGEEQQDNKKTRTAPQKTKSAGGRTGPDKTKAKDKGETCFAQNRQKRRTKDKSRKRKRKRESSARRQPKTASSGRLTPGNKDLRDLGRLRINARRGINTPEGDREGTLNRDSKDAPHFFFTISYYGIPLTHMSGFLFHV
jgi:hypothetical protein